MGYSTDFEGCIDINKKVDEKTQKWLKGLSNTRRMKRDTKVLSKLLGITEEECLSEYGEDAKNYFDYIDMGQRHTEDILNYNFPPSNQPGLWCNWTLGEDNNSIEWNGAEKFYEYIEWMRYIIDELVERGYEMNGIISWEGEDRSDCGRIIVKDSKVNVIRFNLNN